MTVDSTAVLFEVLTGMDTEKLTSSTTLRSSHGSKTSEIPGGIPMKGYKMSLMSESHKKNPHVADTGPSVTPQPEWIFGNNKFRLTVNCISSTSSLYKLIQQC